MVRAPEQVLHRAGRNPETPASLSDAEGLVLLTSTATALSVVGLARRRVLLHPRAAGSGGAYPGGHPLLRQDRHHHRRLDRARRGAAGIGVGGRRLARCSRGPCRRRYDQERHIEAIATACPPPEGEGWQPVVNVAFSSARKWSGATFPGQVPGYRAHPRSSWRSSARPGSDEGTPARRLGQEGRRAGSGIRPGERGRRSRPSPRALRNRAGDPLRAHPSRSGRHLPATSPSRMWRQDHLGGQPSCGCCGGWGRWAVRRRRPTGRTQPVHQPHEFGEAWSVPTSSAGSDPARNGTPSRSLRLSQRFEVAGAPAQGPVKDSIPRKSRET